MFDHYLSWYLPGIGTAVCQYDMSSAWDIVLKNSMDSVSDLSISLSPLSSPFPLLLLTVEISQWLLLRWLGRLFP